MAVNLLKPIHPPLMMWVLGTANPPTIKERHQLPREAHSSPSQANEPLGAFSYDLKQCLMTITCMWSYT